MEELQEELARARALCARLQQLYGELAVDPDPGGAAEQALLRLLGERDRAALPLGRAVLRWLARGGSLVLEEVTPVEEPPPAQAVAPEEGPGPDVGTAEEGGTSAVVAGVLQQPPSAASLEALSKEGAIAPSWSVRSSESSRELRRILRSIGKIRTPTTKNDAGYRLRALARELDGIDRWSSFPKSTQRSLLGVVSSFARHLQDEAKHKVVGPDREQFRMIFGVMCAFSRREQPGFIDALGANNAPRGESWLADARAYLEDFGGIWTPLEGASPEQLLTEVKESICDGIDRKDLISLIGRVTREGLPQSDPRLVELLVPHLSAIKGSKKLKTLKTQIKAAQKREEAQVEAKSDLLPEGWPYFYATTHKAAVIIGGDPRSHARTRAQQVFRFASLSWEGTDPRRVETVAERVRSGKFEVVLLLKRFIGHWVCDRMQPACKEAGVPMIMVDTGYGVTQIQRAIERFYKQRAE